MNRKITSLLCTALLCTTVIAAPVAAEMTGNIGGIVIDPDNDPISGMRVRATDLIDSSNVYIVTSQPNGSFALSNLPFGSYLVSADTTNTDWVQRNENPVAVVSANASGNVRLVLTQVQELSGGSAWTTPAIISTVAAGVAAVAAGVALSKTNSNSDDIADLSRQLSELDSQLQQELNDVNKNINDARRESAMRDLALQQQLRDQQKQLEALEKQIEDLQKDVSDLQKEIRSEFR